MRPVARTYKGTPTESMVRILRAHGELTARQLCGLLPPEHLPKPEVAMKTYRRGAKGSDVVLGASPEKQLRVGTIRTINNRLRSRRYHAGDIEHVRGKGEGKVWRAMSEVEVAAKGFEQALKNGGVLTDTDRKALASAGSRAFTRLVAPHTEGA